MLSIREIRQLGARLTLDQFQRELGPFVLIQKPATLVTAGGTQIMGVPEAARATMIASPDRLTSDVLVMLFQFEDLIVATLPPMEGSAELTVGRAPDCDLVLDDPSVSKRHARLRWNAQKRLCMLEDGPSTNGTYLNASIRIRKAVLLRDGDIISFGEVSFWYLLTPTLFDRFRSGSGSLKLGARSG